MSEYGRYIVSRAEVKVDPSFFLKIYLKLVIIFNLRSSNLLLKFKTFNENNDNKNIKNNTCSLFSEQRRSQFNIFTFNIFTFNISFTFSTFIFNLSFSTAYLYLNGLSSKLDEQTCEDNGGGYEHLSSDSPGLKNKEELWDGMRAEAEVKEGDLNNDGNKDKTSPKILNSEVRNEGETTLTSLLTATDVSDDFKQLNRDSRHR